MKILIVDDSRLIRLANERALAKVGHQVITAEDGDKGLKLALEHKPDLVILDMMLPKLSGPDVLRAIRKNPDTAAIPIMVLTSLSQLNEERLVSEGATSYFEKSGLMLDKGSGPFVAAVEKMLAQARKPKPNAC